MNENKKFSKGAKNGKADNRLSLFNLLTLQKSKNFKFLILFL